MNKSNEVNIRRGQRRQLNIKKEVKQNRHRTIGKYSIGKKMKILWNKRQRVYNRLAIREYP